MIYNDTDTVAQEVAKKYAMELKDYISKFRDNMMARQILPYRKVGADVEIDVVTNYDRTGPGAQIVPKGGTPSKLGVKKANTYFPMYQIVAGFDVNQKDLKVDAKIKSRNLEVATKDLYRQEDNVTINGNSTYNITGIVGAARANTNGKIAASAGTYNNKGAWVGETGTDIYADIKQAIELLDSKYEPAGILGNRQTIGYLDRMSSERVPYKYEIAPLFGKSNVKDESYMFTSEYVPSGYAYIITKDPEAGEFVVSENAGVTPYPMQPGKIYPFEVSEWVTPEIHDNEGFVEIAVT